MIVKLIISVVLSYILYKLFFSKRKALYSLNVAHLHKQSKVLESGVHVNNAYVQFEEAHEEFTKDCGTLYDAFQRGLKNGPQNHCLGHKGHSTPYKWLNYERVDRMFSNLGAGLALRGFAPNSGFQMAIIAGNIYQWVIVAEMCYAYNHILIAIHDTFPPADKINILKYDPAPNIDVLFVDENRFAKLEDILASGVHFQLVVKIGEVTEGESNAASEHNIKLVSFTTLEKEGAEKPVAHTPPDPHDVASILFTPGVSGTTKAVKLSHANIVSNMASILLTIGPDAAITSDDSYLSVIPLCHIYGQLIMAAMFYHGAKFSFVQMPYNLFSETQVVTELEYFRPTIFICPPRIQKALYNEFSEVLKPAFWWRYLFKYARKSRTKALHAGHVYEYSPIESFVFSGAYDAIGGRVKLLLTGYEATTAPEIIEFFTYAFPCIILEVYGMSEYGVVTCTLPGSTYSVGVGPPVPFCQIKLVETDHHYKEIYVKGPSQFLGYLGDPANKTKIDDHGWLVTGDLGEFLPDGTLRIIDRKAFLGVLKDGSVVSPRQIELHYIRAPEIEYIAVTIPAAIKRPAAVICPSQTYVELWAERTKQPFKTLNDILSNQEMLVQFENHLQTYGNQLHELHRIAIFLIIHPDKFRRTAMTPLFTSRRYLLVLSYAKEFRQMSFQRLLGRSLSVDLDLGSDLGDNLRNCSLSAVV